MAAQGEDPVVDNADTVTADRAAYAWSGFVAPPAPGEAAQVRDRYEQFVAALDNGTWPEAEIAAKQMVEEAGAIDVGGAARARALQNLAVAQHAAGDYAAATQNFSEALTLIARRSDNLSADLIVPLRGLAETFLASGRTEEGFSALDRAQHVSHVNFGPHSLQQLPILESKRDYFLARDEIASALDVVAGIYGIYTRRYDRYAEELLPVLYQRAETFRRLKMDDEELNALRHVLEINRRHLEETDVRLIEPNIRLARNHMRKLRQNVYRLVTTSRAEKHLKKALWIAENTAQQDPAVTGRCLVELADFYTIFGMKGRARRHYASAWRLLTGDEALAAARDAYFVSPEPLFRPAPDPYSSFEYRMDASAADPADLEDGEVTVEFTVDDTGRTRDIHVVEGDPPDFEAMHNRVINAVEAFVYRPRYVGGEPADTPGERYRFRYRYLPADYAASASLTKRNSGH